MENKIDEFIELFKEEARELIKNFEDGILTLKGDKGEINELLREPHTLKGSSRMVGLEGVRKIAHPIEDLLVGLREGKLKLSPVSENFIRQDKE